MAAPWILAFSDEIRAVFSSLKRAAREGIAADSVYEFLKDTGHDIVRSEVREVIGRLRLDNAAQQYIRELPDYTKPLRDFIPVSPSRSVKTYRYSMTLIGRDPDTDDEMEKIITLTSNSILTKQEAIDMVLDSSFTEHYADQMTIEGAAVDFIERRA